MRNKNKRKKLKRTKKNDHSPLTPLHLHPLSIHPSLPPPLSPSTHQPASNLCTCQIYLFQSFHVLSSVSLSLFVFFEMKTWFFTHFCPLSLFLEVASAILWRKRQKTTTNDNSYFPFRHQPSIYKFVYLDYIAFFPYIFPSRAKRNKNHNGASPLPLPFLPSPEKVITRRYYWPASNLSLVSGSIMSISSPSFSSLIPFYRIRQKHSRSTVSFLSRRPRSKTSFDRSIFIINRLSFSWEDFTREIKRTTTAKKERKSLYRTPKRSEKKPISRIDLSFFLFFLAFCHHRRCRKQINKQKWRAPNCTLPRGATVWRPPPPDGIKASEKWTT